MVSIYYYQLVIPASNFIRQLSKIVSLCCKIGLNLKRNSFLLKKIIVCQGFFSFFSFRFTEHSINSKHEISFPSKFCNLVHIFKVIQKSKRSKRSSYFHFKCILISILAGNRFWKSLIWQMCLSLTRHLIAFLRNYVFCLKSLQSRQSFESF